MACYENNDEERCERMSIENQYVQIQPLLRPFFDALVIHV